MSFKNVDNIVATLYEGSYHYGVGALINSLVNSNFKGLIYVGYKGNLPPWINQLVSKDVHSFYISDDVEIQFENLCVPMHFGYYKPNFLKHTLSRFPLCKKIFYYDPDIVINAPWNFFEEWVENGVALCLDCCFPFLHHNHPWRNIWNKLAVIHHNNDNKVDYYVNSGFVGLKRDDIALLDRWIDITEKYKQSGGNIDFFQKDGFRSFKTDQDLLNAVIPMSIDIAFSIIGTEGMGFTQPAYLMTHAVNDIKPWNANFVKELFIKGQKPHITQKNFFNYCVSPINIFSKPRLFKKRMNLRAASILSRLIG